MKDKIIAEFEKQLEDLKCILGFHDWWWIDCDILTPEEEYQYCMRCDKKKTR